MRSAALALAALVGASAAGCGGDSAGDRSPGASGGKRPSSAASDDAVVRAWAGALRAGNLDAAAGYFAVPTIAQNGTPPLALRSRAAVRAFNAALPCGAVVLRTRRSAGYLVATFRLTERRGGSCDSGTGVRAATAFRFRSGKISEWRRVPVVPERAPRRPRPPGGPSSEV